MDFEAYWQSVLEQNPTAMESFFHPEALVRWHNTNEQFTVTEFIRANCEYPGDWAGKIVREHRLDNLVITVCRVWPRDKSASFHVTSFIQTQNGLITAIDEYWGDDGPVPPWRQDLKLGRPIHD